VATNLCLNQLEKTRHYRQVRGLDDEFDYGDEPARSNPDRILERDTVARGVRVAIMQLPPHQRAVIEMRHYQDLSYEEISQALGVSLSKVKTDLLRARQTLAKILKE
jgi:RNA polymerase sigma-70 factor (ECF subfamily)